MQKYHSLFYFFYLQALRGMDHGYTYAYPDTSGEHLVMRRIAECYRRLNRHVVFFDVGANTGYYAKEIVDIFGVNAKVHCFEPSLHAFRQLVSHIGSKVSAYSIALSNVSGTGILMADAPGSGLASLEKMEFAPPFNISRPLAEEVLKTTLDEFCRLHKIDRIDILKIDIEGHEYAVLEGAHEMLKSNAIDIIQFEFGHTNIDARSPLKRFYQLLQKEFAIYRIIKSGLIPQFEYSYEYEIYLGTNFLAIRKSLLDQLGPRNIL